MHKFMEIPKWFALKETYISILVSYELLEALCTCLPFPHRSHGRGPSETLKHAVAASASDKSYCIPDTRIMSR